MDPMEFLAEHAPFSDLTAAGRNALARHLEVTWAAGGERLFVRDASNSYLWAVRKGSVRLELDGQLVDDLGPGEVFGLTSLANGGHPRLDAVAAGDCLLYRVHRDHVRALFSTEPAFSGFFLKELSDRLRALTDGSPLALSGGLGTAVAELAAQPPVTVDAGATVGEAADQMERGRVSSVLIVEQGGEAGASRPIGILTDRDLRGRVLAAGRGPETPVAEVMSSPVATLDAAAPASEALLHMLRRGVHHLPLERDGAVVGVIAHSDLLRHHQRSPGALLKKIQKARGSEGLESYAEDVAATVETLHRGGLEATEIGRLVAALNDALDSHLLAAAERELGPPPCAYAWIVFGSEGRQEQSFLTDQDNALIYGADTAAAAEYFKALAAHAVDSLVRVGFPLCAGGFMATNWCCSLDAWRELFRGWIERPEPDALMNVANFFDFRVIHGGLDTEPLEALIRGAGDDQIFIAQLARAAMEMRPPLGFLHRIRKTPKGIDLKAGAVMPIVGLARVFALEAKRRGGSTLRRLRAAEQAGRVSREGAELLAESFRFAFALRLRTQLAARRIGAPIDNFVRPDELSAGERRHLKEAFVAVNHIQTATAQRLDVDSLG